MCNSPAHAMTYKVVNFLAEHGQLPAVKDVDERLIELEDNLTNRLLELIEGLEDEFIAALEERGKIPKNTRDQMYFISQIFDVPFEEMMEVISEESVEGLELGRQMSLEELEALGIAVVFNEFSEEVRDQLYEKVYTFSTDTFERIKGDFAATLAKGYEDGLGIDDIAENLRADFEGLRDYRLRLIARTEVQSAQNEGSHKTLVEYGVKYKQWLTVGDRRVRGLDPSDKYDHHELHGQVVRIDEKFSNGLMYPGDRTGPIGEWINCRCRERPYIPKKDEHIITTPYYP